MSARACSAAPLPAESVPRILVADDDRLTRRLLVHWLGASGHVIHPTSDGAEALAALRTTSFDLAVLDISMPRLSGIELLQRVREIDPGLPVVLVTAGASLPTALRGIELGVLHYMQKPLDRDRLLEVVGRGIDQRRRDRVRRRLLDMVGLDDGELPDEARFASALEQLFVVFQPIVDLERGGAMGYEALVRSRDPHMPGAGQILDAAERLGRLPDLGRRVRALAAEAFAAEAPPEARLFVNLHPSELHDDALLEPTDPLHAIADRVVLEITERTPLREVARVVDRLDALRALGYTVALDDLGAGYASLTAFAALRPEIVKLDMALTRGIDQQLVQQRIVTALVALAGDLDCAVVAEGVETVAERDVLRALGCRFQQGYLYARPQPGFVTVAAAPCPG